MKQHFPLLNARNIAYLDSAATTQKPQVVIDTINRFYTEENANIHRGIYGLSVNATQRYDEARASVARFIGAAASEIIFTSGTTDSLNALTTSLPPLFGTRKEIVLTELEHHANMIPWQELAKKNGYTLKHIRITPGGELDYAHATELIGPNTAVVSFTHVSNAIGTTVDSKRLIALARMEGALTIIDAAQSIAHHRTDVKELDCDFLVFSGHKAYGPTGIGVLYGKNEHLARMPPFRYGGDMIREVTYENATYADAPQKFEAGTPNIAGAIGLAAALTFIEDTGFDTIYHHEHEMMHYLSNTLVHNPAIRIHSPKSATSILSFSVDGVHPHDVAEILAKEGVCIRAGHHCAMPLMKRLGVPGLCRASIGLYTTKDDIDRLAAALKKTEEVFA